MNVAIRNITIKNDKQNVFKLDKCLSTYTTQHVHTTSIYSEHLVPLVIKFYCDACVFPMPFENPFVFVRASWSCRYVL